MRKNHEEETDGTSEAYAVGYSKPPKHTRFQPGRSGNPKGRPKGQQNLKTHLKRALNEKVIVREGERTQRISKLDAFVRRTVNGGLQGDAKQFQNLLLLLRTVGFLDEEERAESPLTTEDNAIIAAFLKSLGHDSEEHASALLEDIDAPSKESEGDT
jgi:hypothetical protein